MKLHTQFFRKIAVVTLMFFIVSSCTENFEELNTNPALVTKEIIKPELLFTNVLKNSIFGIHSTGVIAEYAGYFSNQASGTIFQNTNWSEPFTGFYRNYLINMSEVIRLTAENPRLSNQNAMARIWKVWLFHQLTDAYGDIPYFEAVQDVDNAITQPRYDSQADIYEDMLKELKEAAGQLSESADLASFGSADLLFNGNVEKWRRFANSLRLRLAIRVRYADASLAQEHISEVIGAPLIVSNDQNAFLRTQGEDAEDISNRNPLYNRRITNCCGPEVWTGLPVTENLLSRNDPRLPIYVQPATDGVSGYRGRPIATLGAAEKTRYSEDQTAQLTPYFYASEYNIIVMNAAEVYFLRAEAALASLSAENAEEMYRQGIQTSMEQYNVDPAEIATYLASPVGTLSGTMEEQLEEIIVQKYLAIYFQSVEAWAEFRRTGYPRIWTGSDVGSTGGNIPRRLTYPQDEYAKNGVNVAEAVGRYATGDNLLSRIWWDAKPGLPFAHPKQGTFPPD